MAVVTIQQSVAALYVAVFNRAADAAGLNAWTAAITSGKQTFAQVAAGFAAHEVFTAGIGTLNNTDFVSALYQNILGSAGDAAGIANWTNQLNAGKSKADVAALFVQAALTVDIPAMLAAGSLTAAEAAAATVRQQTLTNKADVGIYFAQTLGNASNLNPLTVSSSKAGLEADPIYNASKAAIANVTNTPASVAAAKDAIAVAAGSSNPAQALLGGSFTLTNGVDTLTGGTGNDTFVAGSTIVIDPATGASSIVDSLQGPDSLVGGAGIDTLKVTLGNAASAPAPTLAGIENVEATFKAAAALSLANATGVQKVTVANSTANASVTGVGAVASFVVADQKATSVVFDNGTATTVALSAKNAGTVSATAPVQVAVNFDDNALVAANLTVENSNIALLNTSAASANFKTVTIAATGSNTVLLTAGAATAESITVTGAGSVDLSGGSLSAVKSLTVADGGAKATITNATANTVTVTTGAGVDTISAVGAGVKSIATGAGNDAVTIATSALASTAVVDLGAGNDALILSAAPTAGATLTGGDGTDTLGLSAANYTTLSGYSAANLAKITGFEVLSISDALIAASTIDVSKIAGIGSFKAAAGVTTAVTDAKVTGLGANSTVTLAGAAANNGTLTASLKTDTAADSLNLVLQKDFTDNNGTTSTATPASHAFVAADVETLNVNSTGINTSLPFTPVDGYKADTITNTLNLTGSDKLTGITVTGDQALVLASTAAMTKLATIDASANTGGLTFSGAAADVTTPTTSAAMTIKGSATASNSLVGSGNADAIVGGAKADSITGGKGGDTLTGNGGNDKFVLAAGDSTIGTGKFDTITDFVANTKGAGAGGALNALGATGVAAADLTGDVLSFTANGTGAGGIIVDVLNSAADASTFLANNAATANTVIAALDATNNNLYVDNSGDGVADFFIHLTGVTTINTGAFELVA